MTNVHVLVDRPEVYEIDSPVNGDLLVELAFQDGPVKEVGVNGIFVEDLLVVVRDRLERYQDGPWKCDENAEAMAAVTRALDALNVRTGNRAASGKLGTSAI
jgi:hypothetical protein